MKCLPVSRRLVTGAVIFAALLFLIWLGFSPIMTKLVFPAIAANAGLEMTAENGRWSLLKGGTLEKINFATPHWSGEIEKLQITWTWQGLTPIVTHYQVSDLRLRERNLSEKKTASRSDAPESRAIDQPSRIFSLLNQQTHLSIINAIIEYGGSTRLELLIPEAELKASNFTVIGKLSLFRVDEEQIGFDLRMTGHLNDALALSWLSEFSAVVSVVQPQLTFLLGSSLSGLTKGVGLNEAEFDGKFKYRNSEFGAVKIVMNSEAPARAGKCDLYFTTENRDFLAFFPAEIREVLSDVANHTAEISAIFSWSPELLKLKANFSADELSSAMLDVIRKPGGQWEFREASAQFRFPGAGFLDINWEESSADGKTAQDLKGQFLAKFKLPHLPDRIIQKLLPNLPHFQIGGGLRGTAAAMPDVKNWNWRAELSGDAMSLQKAMLMWSITEWNLSTSGKIARETLSTESLKISAQDEFELEFEFKEDSAFNLTFKNLALARKTLDNEQSGGILLRRGVLHYSDQNALTYDIVGRDIPSAEGWISPGADRKTEDWSLRGNISLLPGQLNLTDNVLLSPASCESCRLTLNGTLRDPDFVDIHLSGVGVDFTHFAFPSELALAALYRLALKENSRLLSSSVPPAHSEKSSLKVEVIDCLVPRLGRGDIKGMVFRQGGSVFLRDSVINLDVGGVFCDASWSWSEEGWRLDKISGALKTVKLARLRNLFPQNFVPFLTGDFTLIGDFETDDRGTLAGRGTAEWTGADISAVPAMKKLLNEVGEKISPQFARLQIESGHADFRLESGDILFDELMLYGDSGILEISGQYNTHSDEVDAGVVFHLNTETLRKARVRIGNITLAGQTLVTFGRQQDDMTTLPGVLPVRGKLNGNLSADWDAWIEDIGIPAKFLRR